MWCPAGISHGLGEMVPSDSWAGIGQAIRLTMAAFMEADPERAAKEGLTRSTFEARAQERITRFVEQEFEEETAAGGIFNFANEEAARECALGNPAACFKPQ